MLWWQGWQEQCLGHVVGLLLPAMPLKHVLCPGQAIKFNLRNNLKLPQLWRETEHEHTIHHTINMPSNMNVILVFMMYLSEESSTAKKSESKLPSRYSPAGVLPILLLIHNALAHLQSQQKLWS